MAAAAASIAASSNAKSHADLMVGGVFRRALVVLGCAVVAFCDRPAINKEIISLVNRHPEATWTAGINEYFLGMGIEEVKHLLGFRPRAPERKAKPLPVALRPKVSAIPTQFVAADNWPECTTIGTIYNQARCGSCWAFGGVEAASDRFCIATNASFNEILSFGQVTECYSGGCEGGSGEDPWDFMNQNGIVTGACYPYYIPTCPPSQQPCLNFVNTPNCWTNHTCVNGQPWKKRYISNVYGFNSLEDVQTDIMTNGPIEACFDVYEDFLNYKSGVYRHTHGQFLGGHCVKIQGWGVESNTPYWLVNNQWTTYWGDNGQFKILRGSDECGIEDEMVAGTPSV